MTEVQKLKKKRDPTFTVEDKQILVDIIRKYSHIIENKKTDNESMISKNECWERSITEEYNSEAACPRTTMVLKNCWKNLKAEGRKVAADERQGRVKTGGGPKKEVTVDPIMYQVIDMIRPSAVGLSNPYDTDADFDNGTIIIENYSNCGTEVGAVNKQENENINLNGDWSQYSPGQLRKPRATILREMPHSSLEDGEDGSLFLCAKDTVEVYSIPSELEKSTPVMENTLKRPSLMPMSVDEIAPKRSRANMENSSRHQTNRRRPVLQTKKNEELLSKRIEALTTVTSHAEEEHQVIMDIHREKLRQEKIRTRILLLELKDTKLRLRN